MGQSVVVEVEVHLDLRDQVVVHWIVMSVVTILTLYGTITLIMEIGHVTLLHVIQTEQLTMRPIIIEVIQETIVILEV